MDTLDGRYSRMSGKGTLFGAFLDSTLDRIEEGVVLTAVAYHFADTGDAVPAAACVFVVLGSLMVSYTRARAEALGVECKVGIATRPVRVVILSIGLVFGAGDLISDVDLLPASIYAMAALTAFTVGQRVWHVRGELKRARGASAPPTTCNQTVNSRVVSPLHPPRQEDLFRMSETNGHADGAATNGHRADDGKVRVAIVGVGNCANASSRASSTTRTPTPPTRSRA